MKAIIHAEIVLKDRIIHDGAVCFEDRILTILEHSENICADEVIDAQGKWLFPGFIDIHSHGRCGHHVLDGDDGELLGFSKELLKCGVTRFLPATMTAPMAEVQRSLECVRRNMGAGGARIMGAYMEGPFLSETFKGAHDGRYLAAPDAAFVEENADVIRIVVVAPETDTAGDFIPRACRAGVAVSIGHCAASFEETVKAVEAGASSFTHLFNAMSPFHYRQPGSVGAALMLDQAYVEIIGDGFHVPPEIYPLLIKCKSPERILLVSDCQTVGGLPPGDYRSGNMVLRLDEKAAWLENGTLAGSIIGMNTAVKNFYRDTKFSLPQVVRMASLNQAELLKMDNDLGSIEVGKYADFVIADQNFETEMTIVEGHTEFIRQDEAVAAE